MVITGIIHAMYESCRYNKALVLTSYPAWCGLFTRQELQVRYLRFLDGLIKIIFSIVDLFNIRKIYSRLCSRFLSITRIWNTTINMDTVPRSTQRSGVLSLES